MRWIPLLGLAIVLLLLFLGLMWETAGSADGAVPSAPNIPTNSTATGLDVTVARAS